MSFPQALLMTTTPRSTPFLSDSAPIEPEVVVVDGAGARMGGALRYLRELDDYLSLGSGEVRQIGRERSLTLGWLARREILARHCAHSVALNNATFVHAGGCKTVVLRNALHFLSDEERAEVTLSTALRLQSVAVHALLRRADRIVVPSSSMGERVTRACPAAARRIGVMHHPVTPLPPSVSEREEMILCPVLDAPYKKLSARLGDVIAAVEHVRRDDRRPDLRLLLTLTKDEVVALGLPCPPWVELLGRLTPEELSAAQQAARVIVYPTVLESFGFPLAEARLARQPVVAPDSAHTREIADDALVGFNPTDRGSLIEAFRQAMNLRLAPLSDNPFDRDRYFSRLFSTDSPCAA